MFESLTAVIVLIVFLVPGFVWRAVEGQLIHLEKKLEWEKFAFGLLARSTFVYLPVLPLLLLRWQEKWHEQHPYQAGLLAVAYVLILPGAYGLVFGLLRRYGLHRKILGWFNIPTFEQHFAASSAWDSLFSEVKPCWVIVTLKNGAQVRGLFGPDSYVSSDPDNRDIYISHTGNEKESRLVENTLGIYVSASEIQTIELIDAGDLLK